MHRTLRVVARRFVLACAVVMALTTITAISACGIPCGWWIWKCRQWSDWRVAESERRGNAIVAALEGYREAHGVYPGSLRALIPKYLTEASPPVAGNRYWRYHTSESGQDFELAFGDDSVWFPSDSITANDDSWYFDTH